MNALLRCSLLLLALGCDAAQAQGNSITLYGAYREGGGFTEANSGQSLSVEGSGAGAISLDWALDGRRQWQIYLSRQNTHLVAAPSTTPTPAPLATPFPLSVTYLHIGGSYFFDGPVGQGPYVVGGLGATLFQPGLGGYASELRASMNLGLGYQIPLGERVALRTEVRGYLTAVNSSSYLFCSGGCVLAIQGDALTQAELVLGVSFRY
jgi:hypothetical protein